MEDKEKFPTRKIDEGEESKKHHDGSFGKYMEHKIQKLNEQFDNSNIKPISNIFRNISIHVNGLTRPSHQELKHLMALHGGRFNNYYSSSTATHIICSNLPDAKVKQYESERNPTPIVRPEWLTDSIRAGTLLPINNYILWQLHLPRGQRTLFPTRKTSKELTKNPHLAEPKSPHTKQQHNNKQLQAARIQYDAAEMAQAQSIAARLRANCDVLKGKPKSSKDDPEFVQSYYRASRLHFIGRWKARLESLMASSVAVDAPMPKLDGERRIIHLDMDCFFASVTEAAHPEFKNKPIAVCHSNSTQGSGEISSANYEARKFGITAGMFMARAKELCPMLIVVPYEFDRYEYVSEQMYKILLQYSSCVLPLSCDEAFIDVTGLGDSVEIAESIRQSIVDATKCTASAGIGPNMLLARMATKKAKPNGVFVLEAGSAMSHLATMDVSELPGVGWSTKKKLEDANVWTVGDIQEKSVEFLQKELGNKAGQLLWDFAHGRDDRKVEPPMMRKSIGAECNWGIRFENKEDPKQFLYKLSVEVEQRMLQAGAKGKGITLKVKRKKKGWVEPRKFLGMGSVDSVSRSTTLQSSTSSADVLHKYAMILFNSLDIAYDEIRGIGLTVAKLDDTDERAVARINSVGDGLPGIMGKKGTASDGATVGEKRAAAAVNGRVLPLESFFQRAVSPKKAATAAAAIAIAKNDNGSSIEKESIDDGWVTDTSNDGWSKGKPIVPVSGKSKKKRMSSEVYGDGDDSHRVHPNACAQDGQGTTTKYSKKTHHSVHGKGAFGTAKRIISSDFEELPAFSQIDRSVLAELPPVLRKEIENFYDVRRKIESLTGGRVRGGTSLSTTDAVASSSKQQSMPSAALNMARYPRIDAFVKIDTEKQQNKRKQARTRSQKDDTALQIARQPSAGSLTMSQIDPGVLNELPPDVRKEILVNVKQHRGRDEQSAASEFPGRKHTKITQRDTTVADGIAMKYMAVQRDELPESVQQLFCAIDAHQQPAWIIELLEYIVLHTSVLDDTPVCCNAVQCAVQYYSTHLVQCNMEASRYFLRHIALLAHDYEMSFGAIGMTVIKTCQERAVEVYGCPLYLGSLCF